MSGQVLCRCSRSSSCTKTEAAGTYEPQLLHPDSGAPSGVRSSVSAARPSQLIRRLRAIKFNSDSRSHSDWLASPKKEKKKQEGGVQTTLKRCPATVRQPRRVKLWREKKVSVTSACPGLLTLQGSGGASACCGRRAGGPSSTYLISQGEGYRRGCSPHPPPPRQQTVDEDPDANKSHARYARFRSASLVSREAECSFVMCFLTRSQQVSF